MARTNVSRAARAAKARAAAPLPTPTRERILDEVERLIAGKGVYGFKLRDVAEPLDVRVPAIYKHYKSRDDVLV
jgi:AcrR family transcriptional regulator